MRIWKLFHDATWLSAVTLSTPSGSMFCVVLNHCRIAPTTMDWTVPGSPSARLVSGALGFGTSSDPHPPARTRAATRPRTSGIRVFSFIRSCSSVQGSEADLDDAGERPEVRVREPVEPE